MGIYAFVWVEYFADVRSFLFDFRALLCDPNVEGTMNTQDYIDKLGFAPCECSCKKCKSMCHSPCCGSVEDFEKLIDAGYAERLMFDDLPSVTDGGNMLKPALKSHEGKQAPWETGSEAGCTFWKYGKCELHKLGLKPVQGRLAHHSTSGFDALRNIYQYAAISKADWDSERGKALIERWKKLVNYEE